MRESGIGLRGRRAIDGGFQMTLNALFDTESYSILLQKGDTTTLADFLYISRNKVQKGVA